MTAVASCSACGWVLVEGEGGAGEGDVVAWFQLHLCPESEAER